MRRFDAIEGLRGWLAWTVVFSHVSQMTNIHAFGIGPLLAEAGGGAVIVFMIVSGFVITHLIVERSEPYGVYLLRRFMRLFPALAITCAVGYFASTFYVATFSRVSWAGDSNSLLQILTAFADTEHQFFWSHFFAHLTMLHGMISSDLLPLSLYAFNAPAWSVSLEWQFYLIAPVLIFLARDLWNAVWLAGLIAALEVAFRIGLFGRFESPSLLAGALGYFAVGIACRLCLPAIQGTIRRPQIILAVVIVLFPLGSASGIWPLLIWCLVMTGLLVDRSAGVTSFSVVYRHLLESPVATYFGSRSYSVYLCHYPALGVSLWAWLLLFPNAERATSFFGVSFIEAAIVLVSSEFLYRSVELPGIALGSKLARRITNGVAQPI